MSKIVFVGTSRTTKKIIEVVSSNAVYRRVYELLGVRSSVGLAILTTKLLLCH
jgi:hypothetical protein